MVQLARLSGASFVAATSTDKALLTSLRVDRAIDYRKENWWELEEFLTSPLDVVVEVTSGGQRGAAWHRARTGRVVKPGRSGGRFVSLDFGPERVTNVLHMADFIGSMIFRGLFSLLWPFVPRYTALVVMPDRALFGRVFALIAAGELRIVMDPASPFPLTTEGVRGAFNLQSSARAKGRVVVHVSDP